MWVGGVGKNRYFRPLSCFSACCQRSNRQVLYTQLQRTVSSMVSGVICCSRETDDEVFMTRSLNVTPKKTKQDFYRATRMHSADYAAARCMSVRLSVCLSHAGIASKQLYVSSKFFHHRVAPPF